MPQKGALFGLSCCGLDSPPYDTAEVPAGCPNDGDTSELFLSPGVVLTDTVVCLQREVEQLRSDSMYNHSGKTPISSPHPRKTTWTSTKVSKFAGVTSWEQYCLVFDAIVQSNGWDDDTAALQLFSHLEGHSLNVALLVPEKQWTSRGNVVRALSAHYGLSGCLAKYRRQFECTIRRPEQDPSIFAVALETLAVRAFGEVSPPGQPGSRPTLLGLLLSVWHLWPMPGRSPLVWLTWSLLGRCPWPMLQGSFRPFLLTKSPQM